MSMASRSLDSRDHHPDEADTLPTGSHIDGTTQYLDVADIADYVIIGSGAAGANAAWVLGAAGHRVILIEEGPWVRTPALSPDLGPTMRSLFRGGGAHVSFGRSSMVLLQGSCVGGSTTINSAIALRTPEHVLDEWSRDHDLGGVFSLRSLEPHFEALERSLNVRPTRDDVLGEHNRLFGDAASRLGIRAEPTRRFESGCRGSAECLTGCRSGAKLGMSVSLIPQCLKQGAKIYSSTRVVRIATDGGRARAVTARFNAPGAPTLRVQARRGVVVCASAVQTPGILHRSGVRSPALGRSFQCHPGTSLTARFDRSIRMQFGATQGFNSTHFSRTHRFKIESVSLPPELIASTLPGCGAALVRRLADYENLMCWAVALRAEASGRLFHAFGSDHVLFTPTRIDMERFRDGLKVLTQMFFAVGAREVFPSVHGMPTSLRSPDEANRWDSASLDPRAYNLATSHMFGSARLGRDPRTSVVGTDFATHAVRGLYVLDSSVFPSNVGVNPQLSIMAIARLGAERIANT